MSPWCLSYIQLFTCRFIKSFIPCSPTLWQIAAERETNYIDQLFTIYRYIIFSYNGIWTYMPETYERMFTIILYSLHILFYVFIGIIFRLNLSKLREGIEIFPSYRFLIPKLTLYGPRRKKTCLLGLRATKAQTSLRFCADWYCTFLICFLESIIFKLATGKISVF